MVLNHSFVMVNGQDGTIQSTDSLISAGFCELSELGNGTIMVTNLTEGSGTIVATNLTEGSGTIMVTEGSVANYACNDNYTLTEKEIRTCMDNGMLSGPEPTCIRTYEECICDVYTFTSKLKP